MYYLINTLLKLKIKANLTVLYVMITKVLKLEEVFGDIFKNQTNLPEMLSENYIKISVQDITYIAGNW